MRKCVSLQLAAKEGAKSGWDKTPSLCISGELEGVKMWWHVVSQRNLAECKIFNDPALVLALKWSEIMNWDADISLWQKLGSNSQQCPHHPLKEGNEFPLLCTLFFKTMPVNYLAEKDTLDILRIWAFLKCILAKHTFRDVKITI